MTDITDLLDRPIAYHRVFVTLTGSVTAAVLLSQAVYWQKRAKQPDGWFYKTADEWEEETGLSRHEQATARVRCDRFLKSTLRDIPARLYWQVDLVALEAALLCGFGQPRLPEIGKQDCRKVENINRYAETTTETTPTTTTTTTAEDEKREIVAMYAGNFGKLTPVIREALEKAATFYPSGWVQEAMREALVNNKRNWKYVSAILTRWGQEGKGRGVIPASVKAGLKL